MATVTKPVFTDETGKRMADAMDSTAERIASSLEAIASTASGQHQVTIPKIKGTSTFIYDGTTKTVEFENYNNYRSILTNTSAVEPGTYIVTAYLLNPASDTWTDGTNTQKQFSFTIEENTQSTSFHDATTEKLLELVAASDAGDIDLHNDYGWTVGDTREITLAYMPNTIVLPDGTTVTVGESHAVQKVMLTLMDTNHYDLVEPTAGGRTKSAFVVAPRNALIEAGYMNSSNTNSGSWLRTQRRAWCNSIFRDAIPVELRSIFKKFKVITATEYNASTVTETEDYFALFAEKEIFGEHVEGTSYYANATENDALTQIKWFENAANRIIKNGERDIATATNVWERSPNASNGNFCLVFSSGTPDGNGRAGNAYGILPFGCI